MTHKSPFSRPFISLRDVAFRLGEEVVFRDTNWTLETRQQWVITGANGSGKSLLAEAIKGHLPAVGGELLYHFRPPPGLLPEQAVGYVSFEERKADLGAVVLQSRWNSLEEDEALTVRDLLAYERVMEINPYEITAHDTGSRRAHQRRLQRAISLLRIGPFLGQTLLSLSNGETQRVELAKALCRPLRLLILDEPFVGLDTEMRRHVRGLIEHLMLSPLRVLILTTRLEDLPHGVTHLAFVDDCQLKSVGLKAAMLRRPDLRRALALDGRGSLRPQPLLRRVATGSSGSGRILVRFAGLDLRYGRRQVLHNFNWTIREGESWALVGPNGSGKTTLLSLIAGDNPQAYAHEVEVLGHRRGSGESIWELKRKIGWISPELQLHFNAGLTCFDVVGSGFNETIGLFEPLTRAQRRATFESLKEFDLEEHASEPLFNLSPGLQRTVLLARAAVKRPRLLIADEPCQGLDPRHRRRVVSAIDRLTRARAVTVLYATHRPDEMPSSIQHVMRLG